MIAQSQSELIHLDAILMTSDAESMAWNDGGESEQAEAALAHLAQAQKLLLLSSYATKPESWRHCLVTVLNPGRGNEDEALIDALWDDSREVAFEALRRVAYFCGVNASAKAGAFEDTRIRVCGFSQAVARREGVMARIDSIAIECSPVWAAQFSLLSETLERGQSAKKHFC